MQSLSSMVEEDVNRNADYKVVATPAFVRVDLRARPFGESYTPDVNGDFTVWAEFGNMLMSDEWMMEQFTKRMAKDERGEEKVMYDYEERKLLAYRFLLKKWNLNIELEHESGTGWLTEECWKKVISQPAPLLGDIMEKYQETMYMTPEEEAEITKQCAILFSPHSKGVTNGCQAITLYCTLGNFWEKFGINRFDLAKLPYKEYIQLRMVLSRDMDSQRRKHSAKGSPTRVSGPGGKTRPSRGITVDEGF